MKLLNETFGAGLNWSLMTCERCKGSGRDPVLKCRNPKTNFIMQCRDCNGSGETGFVKLWPDEFIGDLIYPTHCQEELTGAYDLPIEFEKPPVILDLGANIGAYLRYCVKTYPGCTIHCYEPDKKNFEMLEKTAYYCLADNAFLYNYAVLDRLGEMDICMEDHILTSCEWSLARGGNAQKCQVIPASELPQADIIKVDTEGAEGPIFRDLFNAGKLNYKAIIFEFHKFEVGMQISGMLDAMGYKKVFQEFSSLNCGVFKFIKE